MFLHNFKIWTAEIPYFHEGDLGSDLKFGE